MSFPPSLASTAAYSYAAPSLPVWSQSPGFTRSAHLVTSVSLAAHQPSKRAVGNGTWTQIALPPSLPSTAAYSYATPSLPVWGQSTGFTRSAHLVTSVSLAADQPSKRTAGNGSALAMNFGLNVPAAPGTLRRK